MSDKTTTIDDLGNEKRKFPPSPQFVATALVADSSLHDFHRLCI